MRIRLQCASPQLKAWVSTEAETVKELKKEICEQFLSESSGRLALSLDGFDLLDSSTTSGVLRDGDIVVIKISDIDIEPPRKRLKTSTKEHVAVVAKKQPKNAVASSSKAPSFDATAKPKALVAASTKRPRAASVTSSDSSSDIDTSSSSSSDDSSDSSSDSDSDSSSDSDSDSPPPSHPIKKAAAPKRAPTTVTKQAPTVPPGHGKAQTHSRNVRRRIKKKYTAAAGSELPAPPPGSSVSNLIPIGPRVGAGDAMDVDSEDEEAAEAELVLAREQDAMITAALLSGGGEGGGGEGIVGASTDNYGVDTPGVSDIFMSSLRNKNKKKGFKSSMAAPIPAKIVFGEDGSAVKVPQTKGNKKTPASVLPFADAEVPVPLGRDASGNAYNAPRLIPPSELQAAGLVPSNLFVTSVDVEEGMHGKKGKKKKKVVVPKEDEWAGGLDYGKELDYGVSTLDYGGDEAAKKGTAPGGFGEAEWMKADRDFDQLVLLSDLAQLKAGDKVGWKELAINTITFCPEMLLHVAKVVSTSGENIAVQPIYREGAALEASFSARLELEEGDVEEVEIVQDYSLSEALEGGWRIIV